MNYKTSQLEQGIDVFLLTECVQCHLLLLYNPSAEAGAASFGPDQRKEV